MKMSDVFNLPLTSDYDTVSDRNMTDLATFDTCREDEAAAHAINQHDALTQLNKELVEALTAIKNDLLERADLDSQDMKAVACSGPVWVQVQDALAKAKELAE